MRKKNFLIFAAVVLAMVPFILPSYLGASDQPSAQSKAKQLESGYAEQVTVETGTLAAPLLLAHLGGHPDFQIAASLLAEPLEPAFSDNLSYEKIGNGGFRISGNALTEPGNFRIYFGEEKDLRNRWVRVRYTGRHVPARVKLDFNPSELRQEKNFDLYLENSLKSETVYFKLPDQRSLEIADSIGFLMEPDYVDDNLAEFTILGVDLLSENESPLDAMPQSDLSRFDWYSAPPTHAEKSV